METQNSFLMALVPVVSTIAYMAREPNFSWTRCIPYILPAILPLLAHIPNMRFVYEALCGACIQRKQKNRLDFTARIRLSSWVMSPDALIRNFSTVLWEWNRNNAIVNCKNLMEETIQRRFWDEDEALVSVPQPIFVDDPITSFWHKERPHIHYTMWVERNTDRDGNSLSDLFLKITFLGDGYVTKNVVDHIDYIKLEAKRINESKLTKQRVLVSTNKDDEDSSGPQFMIYEFATTSSFDNFFAEEAAIVRNDLEHFLTKKSYYNRIGKPWTYTVLNEGPPGVGKTKLVKAIAALTGRTLIVINLAHIPNMETLYEAFHSSVLGGEKVAHENRIYYIPEVDTQMFDMLESRTKRDTYVVPQKNQVEAAISVKKPSLGEILNVLDGVPERHGHILVMDTNHLAQLDPALVRPGRVDRIVSWEKMSACATHKYLENYFETSIPSSIVFPDKVFTAAELQTKVSKCKSYKDFIGCSSENAKKLKRKK
jgi:hypothetical protein